MKKVLLLVAMIGVMCVATTVTAQMRDKGNSMVIVGGYLGLGASMVAGQGYEESRVLDPGIITHDNRTGKFSFSGGGYVDIYFTDVVGLEVGIGFLGNGIRFADGDAIHRVRMTYMEIPLLAKFDVHNFRFGAGLGLWFALGGHTKSEWNNYSEAIDWEDDEWQYVRRFNFGPDLFAGYAIPVGPIFLVPSLQFRMHLINDINRDEVKEDDPLNMINRDELDFRYINLHVNCAVEYTF